MTPITNENLPPTDKKCPFCHDGLVIKKDLLFCHKCAMFIGDPKTFTESFTNINKIKNDTIERAEERIGKKKGRVIWQIIIVLLIIVTSFSIYQFKLWTFIIGIDYSSVKEIQKTVPFTIYLPKKIPLGYSLDKENTNINYIKSDKINSIDFVYRNTSGSIIKVSLFPISDGFTQENKTTGELFSSLSARKNLNKTSIGEQDIYISESDIVLTEKTTSVYNIIAITTYSGMMIKIEYTGSTWIPDGNLISMATSLRSIENL
ncbi:MAG: hypothetical protein COU71_00370 [Parcubacteria group bacterium CG10_big_fil_rev_8_21_14_0_10_38_31]|nr:MAG: hypothetical protein COU71_00370 [Parcubacteria group bacterium CG10_big_fil_rev_8_21_14_0_10_38_31]